MSLQPFLFNQDFLKEFRKNQGMEDYPTVTQDGGRGPFAGGGNLPLVRGRGDFGIGGTPNWNIRMPGPSSGDFGPGGNVFPGPPQQNPENQQPWWWPTDIPFKPGNQTGGGGDYFNTPEMQYALGKFVAPLTGREQRGLGLQDILSGQQFSAGQGGFDELSKTLSGAYTDPNRNPFLSSVLESSYKALQPFQERERSKLRSSAELAGQGGGFSSPLLGQEEVLSEDVLNNLANQIAQLSFGEYGRERGYQQQAGQEARGLPGQGIAGLFGGGGLERGIGQNALSSLYNEFQRMTGAGQQDMQDILKFLSYITGPQPAQYGPSPFESLVGAATPFIRW